jgi:Thermostable hemolysin
MRNTIELPHNACVVAGVQPLLTELQETVNAHFCDQHDVKRGMLEQFIRTAFHQAYGAELNAFYPKLTAFTCADQIRAVVGYRDGMVKPLFSEQYLDQPVEAAIAAGVRQTVERRDLVEVGNLALAGPGEARWVIAATTMLLHAAGYRWVLFTAVKPLFNAFQRLGLKPIAIASPDPKRLPDQGRSWGSYYQAGPVVCAGDIEAGYKKLSAHVSHRQPKLHALLQEARLLGISARFDNAQDIREAV